MMHLSYWLACYRFYSLKLGSSPLTKLGKRCLPLVYLLSSSQFPGVCGGLWCGLLLYPIDTSQSNQYSPVFLFGITSDYTKYIKRCVQMYLLVSDSRKNSKIPQNCCISDINQITLIRANLSDVIFFSTSIHWASPKLFGGPPLTDLWIYLFHFTIRSFIPPLFTFYFFSGNRLFTSNYVSYQA